MTVKYLGAFLDFSGYGEATRHDIGALHTAGVEVSTQYVHFSHETADYGRLGLLCKKLQDRTIPYDAKILHVTPNIFPKYKEEGVYTIGRVFWETNKLPNDFIWGCQCLDEIWTGGETTASAIRNSGIDKPIYIIPEAIDTDVETQKPYELPTNGKFVFYSIFEWTTRKNPRALFEAYFREFGQNEPVALVVKTYVDDFTREKRDEIKSEIRSLRAEIGLDRTPPVFIYTELMDRHQVHRLHLSGDCFISTNRGEGWGIPQMEAMLYGKPVITPKSGGIADYMEHDTHGFMLESKQVPISFSSRNSQWYTSDQTWGEVDIAQVQKGMRKIFSDQAYREKLAQNGQNLVKQSFSLSSVGATMKSRLDELALTLGKNEAKQ